MKQGFYVLMFFILNVPIHAQHSMGLKLNPGISKMPRENDIPFRTFDHKEGFRPSISTGVFYAFSFSMKSSIQMDLLYTRIGGNSKIDRILYDEDNNITGNEASTVESNISYIAVPVSFVLKFRRISVMPGFQISQMVGSSGTNKGVRHENGVTSDWSFRLNNLPIPGSDWGPKIGILYDLTDKLLMEANYYHGLNNLGTLFTKLKIVQITFGLSYRFFRKSVISSYNE